MAHLARLRHVVELPDEFAGPHVPGASVAGVAQRRRFLHARAGDDEVLVDLRRRRQADLPVGKPLVIPWRKSTMPLLPNVGTGTPVRASRPTRNPPDTNRIIGGALPSPGQYSTPRFVTAPGLLVDPDFLAGVRFERNHAVVRRRHVHDAVDDDRGGLRAAHAGAAATAAATAAASAAGRRCGRGSRAREPGRHERVVRPRGRERLHVGRRDVGQRGVARAAGIATVRGPITGTRRPCLSMTHAGGHRDKAANDRELAKRLHHGVSLALVGAVT